MTFDGITIQSHICWYHETKFQVLVSYVMQLSIMILISGTFWFSEKLGHKREMLLPIKTRSKHHQEWKLYTQYRGTARYSNCKPVALAQTQSTTMNKHWLPAACYASIHHDYNHFHLFSGFDFKFMFLSLIHFVSFIHFSLISFSSQDLKYSI